MPVTLRLKRLGKKKFVYFHIVAADSRRSAKGKIIEQIGTYNPTTEPASVTVDDKKALRWLKNGAQPSGTVRSILSREGIMLRLHLMRKGKSEEEIQTAYEQWKTGTEGKIQSQIQSLREKKRKQAEERRAKEKEVSEKRASDLKAKLSALAAEAAKANETPAATEETTATATETPAEDTAATEETTTTATETPAEDTAATEETTAATETPAENTTEEKKPARPSGGEESASPETTPENPV